MEVKSTQAERLPGGITAAQLEQLKKKHGELARFDVTVPGDEPGKEETYSFYVMYPDRKTVSASLSIENDFERYEFLMKNLWVAGDKIIQDDEKINISATEYMYHMLRFHKSELLEPTKAEMTKLKKEHEIEGKVHKIVIKVPGVDGAKDKEVKCFVKHPTRAEFRGIYNQDNEVEIGQYLLNSLLIEADKELEKDDRVYLSACVRVRKLTTVYETKLVNV